MQNEKLIFEMEGRGNLITVLQQSTNQVRRFDSQVRKSSSVLRQHNQITTQQSKNYKFLRGAAQQLGFQLGDYAVQVANGTSKMQAFGQQGAQMLGVFGPIGALLGAGVAIFSAVGVAASKSGKEIKDLGSALGVLQEPLGQVKDALMSVKDAFGSVFPIIVNNIDTALIAAGLFGAYMAGKYVFSLAVATASTVTFTSSMYALGVAVGTVQKLLMRFLPVAIILAMAKAVEMFLQLRKGAGGFAEALVLLKDVASDMFNRILMRGERMYLGLSAGIKGFQQAFINGLVPIAEKFDEFANLLVSKWNQMFSAEIFEPLQLDLGFNVKDQLAQASSEISTEISNINGRIKEIDTALSEPSDAMNKLTQAFRNGVTEVTIFGAKTEEALGGGSSAATALTDMQQRVNSIAETMQSSMTSAFMSIVDGTKSAKEAFKDMARSIIAKLYEVLVVQRLVGQFNAATGQGTGIVGAIMGAFGKRATGGPITAGKPYMVGEKGPELVVPSRNGNVIPNNQLSGGGVTVIQNNTFGAGVSRAEINAMLPRIVETTKAAVFDAQRRSVGGRGYA